MQVRTQVVGLMLAVSTVLSFGPVSLQPNGIIVLVCCSTGRGVVHTISCLPTSISCKLVHQCLSHWLQVYTHECRSLPAQDFVGLQSCANHHFFGATYSSRKGLSHEVACQDKLPSEKTFHINTLTGNSSGADIAYKSEHCKKLFSRTSLATGIQNPEHLQAPA